LKSTNRIPLLSKYFNPICSSNNWKLLLELINEKKKDTNPIILLPLYKNFNFEEWNEQDISLEVKRDMIDHILQVLSEYSSKLRKNKLAKN
jgi:hypothetical protein